MNKRKRIEYPDQATLNEYFYYKDGSLYNKIKRNSRSKKDQLSGGVSNVYIRVTFRRKNLLAHRIIWEMHNGPIPDGLFIDHIDGNPINNKLENLRLVTTQGNSRNSTIASHNKSGCVGVYWLKSKKRWCSTIVVNGSHIWLGSYRTFEEAKTARKEAEPKYGFHPNHGRKRVQAIRGKRE